MKKLVFFIALAAFGQQTGYKYNPFTQNLDLAGNGFTAPSGYSTALSGALTSTITAATHGQGTMPDVMCWQSSNGEKVSPQVLNPSFLGDITLNFSPAFTGTCKIVGPGVNTGAAGDVVGPAGATSGCVAYFSGTSGKIITCAPTGLFYDAANVRLGVGTGTPSHPLHVTTVANDKGILLRNSTVNELFLVARNGSADSVYLNLYAAGVTKTSLQSNGFSYLNGGNLGIGGTTDGNYKLDVQASGSTGTLRAWNQSIGGSTLVVVQAGDTQSGNLLSVRSNAGPEIAYIDSTGNIGGTSAILTNTAGTSVINATTTNAGASAIALSVTNASYASSALYIPATRSASSAFNFLDMRANGVQLFVVRGDGQTQMGIPKFSGTNSTGAGSALLGANSPASTLTAPYTWITVVTSDGSTAYIPAWK